jgi:hypothetical protein
VVVVVWVAASVEVDVRVVCVLRAFVEAGSVSWCVRPSALSFPSRRAASVASVASVRFPSREVRASATTTSGASPTEVETIGVEVVRGSTVVVLVAGVESLLVVEGFGVVVGAAVVVGSAGASVSRPATAALACAASFSALSRTALASRRDARSSSRLLWICSRCFAMSFVVVLAAVVGLVVAELPAVVVLLSLGTSAAHPAVVEAVLCFSVLGAAEESVVVSSAVVRSRISVVVDDVVGALVVVSRTFAFPMVTDAQWALHITMVSQQECPKPG